MSLIPRAVPRSLQASERARKADWSESHFFFSVKLFMEINGNLYVTKKQSREVGKILILNTWTHTLGKKSVLFKERSKQPVLHIERLLLRHTVGEQRGRNDQHSLPSEVWRA